MLLIRDPAEVVASYVRSRETCEPEDIGLLQQGWLLELWDEHRVEVPVIDAADFLRDPEAHLRWLCDWLGIPFTDRMLPWPAGPRASDGVWAPHWYDAVRASTGFEPWRPRETTCPTTTPPSPRPAARRTRHCTRGGCGSEGVGAEHPSSRDGAARALDRPSLFAHTSRSPCRYPQPRHALRT